MLLWVMTVYSFIRPQVALYASALKIYPHSFIHSFILSHFAMMNCSIASGVVNHNESSSGRLSVRQVLIGNRIQQMCFREAKAISGESLWA